MQYEGNMEEEEMMKFIMMPFPNEPEIPDFPNRPWDDDEEE
jgi:hypothetical protein